MSSLVKKIVAEYIRIETNNSGSVTIRDCRIGVADANMQAAAQAIGTLLNEAVKQTSRFTEEVIEVQQ